MEKSNNKFKKIAVLCIAVFLASITIFLSLFRPDFRVSSGISLGERFLEEMNYEKAIFAFEHIISVEPANVDAYRNLSDAYQKSGDRENAIQVLLKGYEFTKDKTLYDLLLKYDNLNFTVSSGAGYHEEPLSLRFIGDESADIYYGIGVGSVPTEKYEGPIDLESGLYHITVQSISQYTGKKSSIKEYEYIVGPMPVAMEIEKSYGFMGKDYSQIWGLFDGKTALQIRDTSLWTLMDVYSKEKDPEETENRPFIVKDIEVELANKKKRAIVINLKRENEHLSILNYKNEPFFDSEIEHTWFFDDTFNYENIIPFSVDGKWGVMNLLGEVILKPQYFGMTNADDGRIIATGEKGTVLLKAVYENNGLASNE